jgi:sterol desaturase/sphingolipid hydroxylase (fatty acid hydroxylase superfamily)
MNSLQQALQVGAIFTIMGAFALAEWRMGLLFPAQANREDQRLDVAATLMLPAVSGAVLAVSQALCTWAMPEQRQAWADWSWWQMVLALLLADDLTQYLWHRLSHTSVLWPLHRAHHSPAYMSVRVVYRNNVFYYALMPGIWFAGALLYLGFGWVYVGYTVVKLTVIMGAHSTLRWDRFLYQTPALAPLAWFVERTISTPATHFAHHALVQDDGIGHYTGNYGNLLFVWDVLFSTAHFSRRYPPAYGLMDDRRHGPEAWTTQMIYPLRQSSRAETVLGMGSHRPPP